TKFAAVKNLNILLSLQCSYVYQQDLENDHLTIVIMKRQKNSYTVEKKYKAIELEYRTSNKFAAKTYFLDLTNAWSVEEAQLYEWIMELHKEVLAVNYSSIKIKIAKIIKLSAELAQDETKNRFLKWYDLFLCHKTNIMQKLPVDLEDKLLKFQQFVIYLCQKNDYPLGMIANMDETLVWFNMVGNDKNQFTMVLTCLADGTKVPLVIIFKEKVWPAHTLPLLAGVVVWFQDKGSDNTDLAIIPRGLTSLCQPFGICLNKLFKDKLCQYWYKWIANGGNSLTKSGNLKHADLNTVCYWVLEASKDHLIYENDSENSKDAESVNN
ncbi:109_t:CDS:2, partial [Gigaspora margarita]